MSKTVSAISEKTHGLFGGSTIDASSLGELKEALYAADFGGPTADEILARDQDGSRRDKGLEGRPRPRSGPPS